MSGFFGAHPIGEAPDPDISNKLNSFLSAELADFFFDAVSGLDANDGLTPFTAKQTVAAANALITANSEGLTLAFKWGEGQLFNDMKLEPTKRVNVIGYGDKTSGYAPLIGPMRDVVGVEGDWSTSDNIVWQRSVTAAAASHRPIHCAIFPDGEGRSRRVPNRVTTDAQVAIDVKGTAVNWTRIGSSDCYWRNVTVSVAYTPLWLSLNGVAPREMISREDRLILDGEDGDWFVSRQSTTLYLVVKSTGGNPGDETSVYISNGFTATTPSSGTYTLKVFSPHGNPGELGGEVLVSSYLGAATALDFSTGNSACSGSTFRDVWFVGGSTQIVLLTVGNHAPNENTDRVENCIFTDVWWAWSGSIGLLTRHQCRGWVMQTTANGGGGIRECGLLSSGGSNNHCIKVGAGIDDDVDFTFKGHPIIEDEEIRGNLQILAGAEDCIQFQASDRSWLYMDWVFCTRPFENGLDTKANGQTIAQHSVFRFGGHLAAGAAGGATIQANTGHKGFDNEYSMITGHIDASKGGTGGWGLQTSQRGGFTEVDRSTIFCNANHALTVGTASAGRGRGTQPLAKFRASLIVCTRDATTIMGIAHTNRMDLLQCTLARRAKTVSDVSLITWEASTGALQAVSNVHNCALYHDAPGVSSLLVNRNDPASKTGVYYNFKDCGYVMTNNQTNWMRNKSDTPTFLTAAQIDAGVSGTTLINVTNNILTDPTRSLLFDNPDEGGASYPGNWNFNGDVYFLTYDDTGGTTPQKGEKLRGQTSGAEMFVRDVLTAKKRITVTRGSAAGEYGTPGYRRLPGNTTAVTNGETLLGSFGASVTAGSTLSTARKLRTQAWDNESGTPQAGYLVVGGTSGASALMINFVDTGTAGLAVLAVDTGGAAIQDNEQLTQTADGGTFVADANGVSAESILKAGAFQVEPHEVRSDIVNKLLPNAYFEATSGSRLKVTASTRKIECRNNADTGVGADVFNSGTVTITFEVGMKVYLLDPFLLIPSTEIWTVESFADSGKTIVVTETPSSDMANNTSAILVAIGPVPIGAYTDTYGIN